MRVQKKTMKTMAAAGLMAAAVMGVSMSTAASATANPAASLVGSGCAAYAQQVPSGPGSVTGMAQDPVAVAASNNPLLTTLTAAVSGKLNPRVNLVDTLNGGQFTVFAPVDAAFAKIAAADDRFAQDRRAGSDKILTYHVVPGQLSPSAGRRRRTRRSRAGR